MPYIDETYYISTYQGETVHPDDFQGLMLRAEEIVEEMTMYRLTPVSFLVMPDAVQERVKKAVCAQIEYLDANGGADLDNGSDLQSAGLGKFNYTRTGSSSSQSMYAPRAQRILFPTGLLYRGGGCW